MKRLLQMALLGLSLSLVFSCSTTIQEPPKDSALKETPLASWIYKADKIPAQTSDSLNALIADYQRIEKEQNGVCDTCVTGYTSALTEYRLVSKELSDRTASLRAKIESVNLQIRKIDSTIANNEIQLSQLRAINHMTRRKKTKQKNEFYALTKGD